MSRYRQTMAQFLKEYANVVDSNGYKISDWCIEGRNDFSAYCTFCKVFLKINRDVGNLYNHFETLRHIAACEFERDRKNHMATDIKPTVEFSNTSIIKPLTISIKSEPSTINVVKSEAVKDLDKAANSITEGKRKKHIHGSIQRPDSVIQRTSKRLRDKVNFANYSETSNSTMDDFERFDIHNLKQTMVNSTVKSFRKALKINTSIQYDKFMEDFNDIVKAHKSVKNEPLLYDKNILINLVPEYSSKRSNKASAMSWFPSSENLVLAIGDGGGNVNLSNIKDFEMNFHIFSVHSEKISHLKFNPFNPFQMISSSIDGTLICCDMQAQKFTEVARIFKGSCTYFDFINPSSYIVSLTNGRIAIADSREAESEYKVPPYETKIHNHVIHTVNMHPVNNNYFVTAVQDQFFIWDLRNLQSPPAKSACHEDNIYSAAFSPVSGKYIMSASMEKICIYDSTSMMKQHMECLNTMDITDCTARTRPVWVPNSDDHFACSYKNFSYLHVFDINFNIYEKLIKDHSDGYKAIVAFHPSQIALACTSPSANKITVFEKLVYY